MRKKQKLFIVRGIDLTQEDFSSPTGVLNDKATFVEVPTTDLVMAASVMMNHPAISTMMPGELIATLPNSSVNQRLSNDGEDDVFSMKIRIYTHFDSYVDLRPLRTQIWQSILTWAEKSRIKGVRGFRASAVKELTCKTDKNSGNQVITTEVLLATAICYTQDDVIIGSPNSVTGAERDVSNLSKQLDRVLASSYSGVVVDHSRWGRIEF